MKLKLLFILLTFGSWTSVQGQTNSPCQMGQQRAQLIIFDGSTYFPRQIVESSLTLRKMLELDYGIKDGVYDNGTCILMEDEAECFYKIMKTEIEKKWGKDFLKTQGKIANKLDKEGKGYLEPKENGIADSIVNLVEKEYVFHTIKVNYLVAMTISPDKEIIDVSVLSGVPMATEISRDSDDYLLIKGAVQKIEKVYQPGQLRGKPVESTLSFWVELCK